MGKKYRHKVLEVFNKTAENEEIKFNGKIEQLEHCTLMYKAAELDILRPMLGCNCFMFNMTYKEKDSILMVFAIPLNLNGKHVSEKVMEITAVLEDAFTTLDYRQLIENKADRYMYLSAIKSVEDAGE